MTKRSRDSNIGSSRPALSERQLPNDADGTGSQEDPDGSVLKKQRSFMATLACDACRNRKSRCDEDRPRCGKSMAEHLHIQY